MIQAVKVRVIVARAGCGMVQLFKLHELNGIAMLETIELRKGDEATLSTRWRSWLQLA